VNAELLRSIPGNDFTPFPFIFKVGLVLLFDKANEYHSQPETRDAFHVHTALGGMTPATEQL
jgi:hypothetical protein